MSTGSPSVPCPLRAAALAWPEAEAIASADGIVSYAELDRRVTAAARRLRVLGVGRRIALHLPKDERYLALVLAVIRAGVVVCTLSTRLPPGGVAPLLQKAACSVLISDDQRVLGAVEDLRKPNLETLLAASEISAGRPEESPQIPLDRPSTVIFTSGSTGTPKAALHTFGNHYHSALGSNTNIALGPGDRWLHSLPLYHVGGLGILFRCLLAGATVALPGPAQRVGDAIAALGATHVSLVPTQLLRLLREDADLAGVKAVLLGGGPIPAQLVDEARGLPIHTSYGLTEMASQVTTTPPGATADELHTAGHVLPYREVAIADNGEILVKGETLFAGYVEGAGINLPLGEGGWFHTGDLGGLDGDGRLRVSGRADNLFVSGGENVQPEEIEEALCRLDGVEEAVVVPVPDAEFGERPVAFVRSSGVAGDLALALASSLPRFKIPVAFHPWEGAGTMKPDRLELKGRAGRLGEGAEGV
ncbi:MAG: o-succinylbenzoate--CoA ligase [Actinomycetota bacterium]|nr:o-succinylbenzoate--CoA ligase [Actinomycetota bacterium]